VKESLFNIIQAELLDARALDLFSGTGSLGLEALSRGATKITFVEQSSESLKILSKNIQMLEVAKEVEVVRSDVFKYLKAAKDDFTLVFIDPPFTEQLAHSALQAISVSRVLAPGALVLIESAKKEHIEDEYSSLSLLDRRTFGDKSLSIYRRA
jgi:16S rRNA (guanine966-N2)-methyltransferase